MAKEEPILKGLSVKELNSVMRKLEKTGAREYKLYTYEKKPYYNLMAILGQQITEHGPMAEQVVEGFTRTVRQIMGLGQQKWGIFARFLRVEHALREDSLNKLDTRLKFAKSTLDAYLRSETEQSALRERLIKLKSIGAEIDAAIGEYNAIEQETDKDLPEALKQCERYNDEQIRIAERLKIKILEPGLSFMKNAVKPQVSYLLMILKESGKYFARIETKVKKLEKIIRKQLSLAEKRKLYVEEMTRHLTA